MGRGDVVRYAVDPRSHRTPAFAPCLAAPHADMDFLRQIALPVGILLMRVREPIARSAVFRGNLSIKPLSTSGRTIHSNQIVVWARVFLRDQKAARKGR